MDEGGRFANRPYQKFGGYFRLDDAACPPVYEDALDLLDEGFDVPAGDGGDFYTGVRRRDGARASAVGGDEVHLVEDEELGFVGEVKLVEGVFDDLDLGGAAGVGGVDDVEEEVGVLEELQGGVEGGYDRGWELVDEADSVGNQDFVAIGEPDTAGDGVEGGEEAVGRGDAGVGQGVEEGALAGVGVADEGGDGQFRATAAFAVESSGALNALNLALEALNSAANEAPVGLYLGLAGAAGADAATESLKVGPLAREAG